MSPEPVAAVGSATPHHPPDRPAVGSPGFGAVLAARLTPANGPRARLVTLGEMVASLSRQATAAPPAARMTPPGAATLPPGSAPAPVVGETEVIQAARRYLGVPYRWGGTNPRTGLDCSGFVQRVFADLGVRLPRVSADQARAGVAVDGLAQARPGDLVFWRGSPNHIGIYAGDGRMIVAPRTGDVVRFQDLTARRPPDAIRRVV